MYSLLDYIYNIKIMDMQNMTVQIKHDGMEKNKITYRITSSFMYVHRWTSKINRWENLLVSN